MSSTRFLPPTIHGVLDYAAAAGPTRPTGNVFDYLDIRVHCAWLGSEPRVISRPVGGTGPVPVEGHRPTCCFDVTTRQSNFQQR